VTLAAAEDADNLVGAAVFSVTADGFAPETLTATEVENDPITSVLYVDPDAPGLNSGASWPGAYSDLQLALTIAAANPQVAEIRVANGLYRPAPGPGNRFATFALHNGLRLRGGYAGYGAADPDARDFVACASVLSGDLAGDDDSWFGNRADNVYHVVDASSNDATAVLDGFTIYGGQADGIAPYNFGGGIYVGSGSPTIRDCTLLRNAATNGAGLCIAGGQALLTRLVFIGNSAGSNGGGLYIDGVFTAPLAACRFAGNSAGSYGGGLYAGGACHVVNATFSGNSANMGGGAFLSYAEEPYSYLTNCTFTRNSAGGPGGGAGCNGTIVTNCIFWDNFGDTEEYEEWRQIAEYFEIDYSCVQGWSGNLGGTGNHGNDPRLADPDGSDNVLGTADDNLRLNAASPCIDAGSNAAVPIDVTLDADRHPRYVDDPAMPNVGSGTPPIVDMGAYERNPFNLADLNMDGVVNGADLALFALCLQGPEVPLAGGCDARDFEADDDIDLKDFALLQRALTGGL
jgi:predicted outer membrane repeat protein